MEWIVSSLSMSITTLCSDLGHLWLANFSRKRLCSGRQMPGASSWKPGQKTRQMPVRAVAKQTQTQYRNLHSKKDDAWHLVDSVDQEADWE